MPNHASAVKKDYSISPRDCKALLAAALDVNGVLDMMEKLDFRLTPALDQRASIPQAMLKNSSDVTYTADEMSYLEKYRRDAAELIWRYQGHPILTGHPEHVEKFKKLDTVLDRIIPADIKGAKGLA